MQIVYAICVVAVLVFIGQLDHVAFPYWFEHGLVSSVITGIPALAGVALFAYNLITICTLNTIVGISIIAGAAFYVGREVRDHEKLGGEFDYKGLGAPLGYAYLRAHARLLRVELVLLLLPAREFKHGALAVELFHLGVVLSLLARAVLAPAFDLFDLLEACLEPVTSF